ncbi:MAG: carboxymuconolactone decarboxylase family protein [Armatimonadota bacterium]|nr:carboxymuconolactone decarboxylase family protein [Armatimonadota bacterium]
MGAVWTRPGLPWKVRSLLTVAMKAALKRAHELRLHLRGALRNGCTAEEIRETVLQAAVYAGMPAALDAFRVAREILAEATGEGGVAIPSVEAYHQGGIGSGGAG